MRTEYTAPGGASTGEHSVQQLYYGMLKTKHHELGRTRALYQSTYAAQHQRHKALTQGMLPSSMDSMCAMGLLMMDAPSAQTEANPYQTTERSPSTTLDEMPKMWRTTSNDIGSFLDTQYMDKAGFIDTESYPKNTMMTTVGHLRAPPTDAAGRPIETQAFGRPSAIKDFYSTFKYHPQARQVENVVFSAGNKPIVI